MAANFALDSNLKGEPVKAPKKNLILLKYQIITGHGYIQEFYHE
jgi:hypothetical protein